MTALAVCADRSVGIDPARGAGRLVVSDDEGVVVGWVELTTGQREVRDVVRGAEFHDAVDLWLELVGTVGENAGADAHGHPLQVTETRFPDASMRRTLVIPLLHY
jgi:NADPH-dependent glutamate synthase beta subunit-like oxidoreductase